MRKALFRSDYFHSLPHKQAWQLAWPMIVSNMSVPLMGLADTAMLGHLESSIFLAAVAIGSNIIALFYWMFAFLRMGTTSAVAQAVGADQPALAVRHLSQNIFLSIVLGTTLVALHSFMLPIALWLIAPESELQEVAKSYCEVRIFSAPAVLITYVAMGWMIALKRPKTILVISLISNGLNVGLDYLFIVQWQMDAKGAALASVIAEYFACLCAIAVIIKSLRAAGWFQHYRFSLRGISANLSLNADLFVRTLCLLFVINFFNAQGATFGNDVLAANALLFQCVLFIAFFLDGYALAAETMTARAIGRRHLPDFYAASAVTTLTAFAIAVLLSVVFAITGPLIINTLSDIETVKEYAYQYLPWLVFMPLINIWCYALDGIFIGAGQTRIMRNSMVFSVIVGFLLVWWASRPYGNHGLWLSFALFNIFRGASLGLAYWHLRKGNLWLNANILSNAAPAPPQAKISE